VHVPSEAVAINKINISVSASPWRSYQKVASSSASSTSTLSWTSPISTTSSSDIYPNTQSTSVNDWGDGGSVTQTVVNPISVTVPNVTGMYITGTITNMNATTNITGVSYHLKCYDCGTIFKTDSGLTLTKSETSWVHHYVAGSTHANHQLSLEITVPSADSNKCVFGTLAREIVHYHSHTIAGAAFSHSHSMDHTHDLVAGIYSYGSTNPLKLEIMKAGTSTWITPSGWESFTSKTNQDLADYFAVGVNQVRISLASGSIGRFQFDAFCQVYIRSQA